MTFVDLTGLLEGVRKKTYAAGPAVTARCPACEGAKGPHLLAYEGSDGWWHVSCIKGCSEDSILGALGLKTEDRRTGYPPQPARRGWPPSLPEGRRAPETPAPKPNSPKPKSVDYIYRDMAGMPVIKKVRWYKWEEKDGLWSWRKQFTQHSWVKGHWEVGKAGAGERAKIIYNLPAVREAVLAGEEVYINEGEKACDAMAFYELVGTCQPEGVGKGVRLETRWLPEHTKEFAGALVTIVADRDAVGEAYASYVGSCLLGVATRVRIVQSATLGEKDDGFDHLKAQFTPGDFVVRDDLLDNSCCRTNGAGREVASGGASRNALAGKGKKPPGDGGSRVEVIEDREPRDFPLTETGNAERLVYYFGQDLRWCPDLGNWLVWEGHRWKEDKTGDSLVQQKALATARLIQKQAYAGYRKVDEEEDGGTRSIFGKKMTKSERARMFKYGLDAEDHAQRRNMVSLAKWIPGVAVLAEDFDADDMLCGVPNGVIDLRTGELRRGRRDDLISKRLGCDYDPDAQCPEFDEFLAWALGWPAAPAPGLSGEKLQEFNDLVGFVDTLMGYTLSGSAQEELFVFAHGSGGNGKGTLFRLIEAIMGDYAKTLTDQTLMVQKSTQIPQDIAQLKGMRLAIVHETMEGAQFNESLLKTLSGRDRITARLLHQNETTFDPHFTLWIAGNHKPVIRTFDRGFDRRLKLLPFRAHKEKHEQDPELKDRLELEMPGILARMVRGCLKWQGNGIVTPDLVQKANDDYKEESDAIMRFVRERCERDEMSTVGAMVLYKAFQKWSKETGDYCGKEIWFKRMMQGQRFEQVRRSEGKVWLGIRLLPEDVPQKALDGEDAGS